MKRYAIILAAAFAAAALPGCNKDNGGEGKKPVPITVEPASLVFAASGAGEKTVMVAPDGPEWTVEVGEDGADWCRAVKSASGKKYTVKVSVEDNGSADMRETEVHIVSGDIRAAVRVTQYGKTDPATVFNVCGDTAGRPLDTFDEFYPDGRPKLYGKLIFHRYVLYGATDPSSCWEYDFWTGRLTELSDGWDVLTINPMNVEWAANGKYISFMGYSGGSWKVFLWDLSEELPAPISPGEDPKLSYDCTKMVWKRDGVLYEYDMASGSVTRLTPPGLGPNFHIPCYLPDGERVVYCNDIEGAEAIGVYDKRTRTAEIVADLAGVDYYPVGRDRVSFYFSAHTRDNVNVTVHDQVWMGFYDKSAPRMFPWNSDDADTSDACYVCQDWVMVCSTRSAGSLAMGGYDYYIARVNGASPDDIRSLNLYCDGENRINTPLEELGASYLPSRLMYNSGRWVETAPGMYWDSPEP